MHPDDLARAVQEFDDAVRNRARYVSEYRLRLADGTERVVREPVAATSVGFIPTGKPGEFQLALDLVYLEDSRAEVDLNMVGTRSGNVIEVQGTAEGAPVPRKEIDQMIDIALRGIERLTHVQEKTLAASGVVLDDLLIK